MANRAPKRRAISQAPTNDTDKHERFTQWAKDRGIEINGVQAARIPGRGLGLLTTRALKEGRRILFVPDKAMFKPDFAMLKREQLDQASPQAQLAVSSMLAFKQGEGNTLPTWSDTWPTQVDFKQSLPMCWSHEDQDQLPPSVQQPLQRQLADYAKDWTTSRAICDKYGFSESDFTYHWMIVNSRSFHWKPPRGKAGMMVMCPFIDYLNHGPTGTTCRVTQYPTGYEVVADRDYAAGEEVLATYGAHSNDKLLVHYGFILSSDPSRPNSDDDIRLDHLILPQLDASLRAQLQDVGYLGSYALLPASNELCFKTQVAIRAILQTCNEWEYFVACGEDLTTDCTVDVEKFVEKLLREWRSTALMGCAHEGMLGLRWKQIVQAIDAFTAP